MGTEATPHPCPNCAQLQQQLDVQKTLIEELKATLAQLQAQLAAARKNSSTSSKPPSSDLVKPPKPPPPQGQEQRGIGGQPGHPKHERVLFPPEQLNGGSYDYFWELCHECGHGLQPSAAAPRVVQQIEIQVVPLEVQAHCSHPGWCPHCQKTRYAPLPSNIERGG